MNKQKGLVVGKGHSKTYMIPAISCNHGLIAGATGTGKTITLQVLAEAYSSIGVPVFITDTKNALSGLGVPGIVNSDLKKRLKKLNITNYTPSPTPIEFWDIHKQKGLPIRITISDLGPILLTRLLNLTKTQSGVLQMVFRIADDMGLLLLDIKDLRAMLNYVGDNRNNYTLDYGYISKQSISGIQRSLSAIEGIDAGSFLGEPALDINDFIKINSCNKGIVNILNAKQLIQAPALYTTFLLWLLAKLSEVLPDVNNTDKPRFVLFIDEVNLIFDSLSHELLVKIEHIIKFINSKGVCLFFIAENPLEIPECILKHLDNKIQHALPAYTPRDLKVIKAVSQLFYTDANYNIAKIIGKLDFGEALVSFIDEQGRPSITEKTYILPPHSLIGSVSDKKIKSMIDNSPLNKKYHIPIDRDSAYEFLIKHLKLQKTPQRISHSQRHKSSSTRKKLKKSTDTPLERAVKSAATSIGRQVGNSIIRGILGLVKNKDH